MAKKPVIPTAEVQDLRVQADKMEAELEASIKEEAIHAHEEQIGGAAPETRKEDAKAAQENKEIVDADDAVREEEAEGALGAKDQKDAEAKEASDASKAADDISELQKSKEKEDGEDFDETKPKDETPESTAEDAKAEIVDADAVDAANGDSRASMSTSNEEEKEPVYEEEGDIGQSALDQLSENAAEKPELDKAKVIEAALFLSNKPLTPAELALLSHCTVKQATRFIYNLQAEYDEKQSALQIDFINNEARLQVRSLYLPAVSQLSKEIELSRKSLKILALVAKKGQILQSGLKNYFRGEIYEYVTELKDRGYIISEKHGNTRMLKPTRKFFEHFQQAQ